MLETQVQSLGCEELLEKEMTFYHFCLENSMASRACQAIVHSVTKSWGELSMHAGTYQTYLGKEGF